MTILVVGQNPKTLKNKQYPFEGTRSGRVLKEWLEEAGCRMNNVIYANAHQSLEKPTEDDLKYGRQILSEIVRTQHPDGIVAVGKVAKKALSALGLEFIEIPHPSGLNRALNDPRAVNELKLDLRLFFNEIKISKRHKYNQDIVAELQDLVMDNPELRFNQILHLAGIELVDFYEESIDSLFKIDKNIRKFKDIISEVKRDG